MSEFKDTEEMLLWRSINQEGVNDLWNCAQEVEVLEKYKVEETKKGACKGGGEPWEWRIVRRVSRYQPR